jgi:hypothetical protein
VFHVCDEIEYRLTYAATVHLRAGLREHFDVKASFLIVVAALSTACASKPQDTANPPVVIRPLERMAGQEMVVLPVQYLSGTDSLGWQAQIRDRAGFLATLDDQFEAALTARGLGQTWTFGREIARASKINSIVMRDAHSLSAESLRGRVLPEATVRDPLASQVRGLVGLKGQRYALLPVELRTENRSGMGVAILRVVMIDSRMALIKGVWDVPSDPMKSLSPALTASVATHFADLVVAP